MQKYQIKEQEAGQRLDKMLHKLLPEAGSGFLYKMLRKKNITLNGKKAEGKEMLSLGDTIELFFSEETFMKFSGKRLDHKGVLETYEKAFKRYPLASVNSIGTKNAIQIIHEDENVLICNKPAGILSQKAEENDISINEWMIGYLVHTGKISEEILQTFKPSVCNRLDRNTSGLVICGISLTGSQVMSKLIHDRSLQKFYHAVVKGRFEHSVHSKGYLLKHEATNKVEILQNERPGASPIETAMTPVKITNEYTLLEVELITGKPHQIRAHLQSMGHPILGDPKYGDPAWNRKWQERGIHRQLLHAFRLKFPELAEPGFEALSDTTILAQEPDDFSIIFHE
ncbi:MAG: RluA family pseudouridine synthase [Lachnospiraceae bacterium]|nr:RluA family pseudouridine synthase [Lachnospiraceae bacterium]